MDNQSADRRATSRSIKAARRNAVDFNASGKVKSDYWHQGLSSEVVSRNHSQLTAIRFYPEDGVGVGVALTECEYTQGIVMPEQSIFTQLPTNMQHVKEGVLVITWPGYQHLKWKADIVFVHPSGFSLTVGHMASQIACRWRRFYQQHSGNFRGPGRPLGANHISFNHLRLLQLYSNDGRVWQAEVSYMKT